MENWYRLYLLVCDAILLNPQQEIEMEGIGRGFRLYVRMTNENSVIRQLKQLLAQQLDSKKAVGLTHDLLTILSNQNIEPQDKQEAIISIFALLKQVQPSLKKFVRAYLEFSTLSLSIQNQEDSISRYFRDQIENLPIPRFARLIKIENSLCFNRQCWQDTHLSNEHLVLQGASNTSSSAWLKIAAKAIHVATGTIWVSENPEREINEFFNSTKKQTILGLTIHTSNFSDLGNALEKILTNNQSSIERRVAATIAFYMIASLNNQLATKQRLLIESLSVSKTLPGFLSEGFRRLRDGNRIDKNAELDLISRYLDFDLGGQSLFKEISFEGESKVQEIHEFDIVIVCALQQELEALKTAFGFDSWEPFQLEHDLSSYERITVKSNVGDFSVIAAAAERMGLVSAAVLTTKMTLQFNPQAIFMVGIAGGFKKEDSRNFGDVLVASRAIDYEAGKFTMRKNGSKLEMVFIPDQDPIPVHPSFDTLFPKLQREHLTEIVELWQRFSRPPNSKLQMHYGPIVSGDRVIDAKPKLEEIKGNLSSRRAIGVEMEIYSVYRAARYTIKNTPYYLAFKSISDFAEEKTDKWREYAMFTAAQYCSAFVRNNLSSILTPRVPGLPSQRNVLSEEDIVILLKSWLSRLDSKQVLTPINMEELDVELNLPSGSVQRHVKQAANECNLQIAIKTDNIVQLKTPTA